MTLIFGTVIVIFRRVYANLDLIRQSRVDITKSICEMDLSFDEKLDLMNLLNDSMIDL